MRDVCAVRLSLHAKICIQILQKTTAATINELKSVSKAGEISEETLMGVRTVQAFNAQDYMTEK